MIRACFLKVVSAFRRTVTVRLKPDTTYNSVAIALVAAGLLAGCSAGAVPSRESGGRTTPGVPVGGTLIRGAGATFPSVLYEEWFRRYQAAHPKSVVAYDAVGTGEGIRRFIGLAVAEEEKVDFGASDAALQDAEIAKVPGGALLVPLTAGSVALAYELPDLPGDLRLSREAYAGIFLGTIRNWNDPRIARANPGVKLPNLTITTVVRQDSSGTTFAFTKHLDAISDVWRSQFGPATSVNWPGNSMRAVGNEGVAARIKQSLGSVGYVSYEFARKIGLKVALLENRAGRAVGPTEHAAAAALAEAELPDNMRAYVADPSGHDAYPIVTLTWVLLYRSYPDARKHQALHDLFRWCLTDGQQYAAGLGYIPLPPDIVRRSVAALDEIRATH
jgi:phosphate transport system substrate-binding protein